MKTPKYALTFPKCNYFLVLTILPIPKNCSPAHPTMMTVVCMLCVHHHHHTKERKKERKTKQPENKILSKF